MSARTGAADRGPAAELDVDRDLPDDDGRDAAAGPSARRGRGAVFIALPIAVVLLALVVVLATRAPASDRQVDSPLLGRQAPRIEGQTLEGRSFDSATYDGRWLVVNFFATWCVPCVQEHPELIAFQRAQQEAGQANVVSVVFSDDRASVEGFFERNGGEWPVVLTEDTVVAEWGVAGVPESYLVDPGGVVRAKLIGGVTAAGLDSILGEAGGGPATETTR
ncbi:TlpA disulfide reductase family protein [Iamia sp.]|uniref:TlpA family protein disulfide reductase n=1 Tax=Iamia sp. TaxID=2722710 RepID=UPI002C7B4C76|nr:TlpA disulfide reductase family protein [Iamia sp.]HXH58042.1 TlpA disulfide reductase family protein [Iamia sp.]